jgi:hypothetical protein
VHSGSGSWGGRCLHSGSGSWGGRCPSLAHYVTGIGATAAGGRSCCLSSRYGPSGGSAFTVGPRGNCAAQSVAGICTYVPSSNGPGSEKPSIDSTFA